MVLEHIAVGVGPVQGNLAPVVIAHDIDGPRFTAGVTGASDTAGGTLRLAEEAVHPTTVDVSDRVIGAVRSAAVSIGAIVVRALATATIRVGVARERLSVWATSNAINTGIRAEVGVEGPVLLHDDHDVADLVDALQRLARASTRRPQRDGDRDPKTHARHSRPRAPSLRPHLWPLADLRRTGTRGDEVGVPPPASETDGGGK